MNLFRGRNAVTAVTAAFGLVLMSTGVSFAVNLTAFELRIDTNNRYYYATQNENDCALAGSDCFGITMCGSTVYIVQAQEVIDSYWRGDSVNLFRTGENPHDPLCTEQL